MAAHDAQSYLDFTSSNSWTHTPTGTPRGVIVHIAQNVVSTDLITAVTYGGVRMNRVVTCADTTVEPGRVYTYFLGVGIPTGAQTVAVTVASGTDAKTGWCQTLTGSSDLEVVTYASVTDDQKNPAVTLPTIASFNGIVSGVIFSGAALPSAVVPGTGYTAFTGSVAGGTDFGSQAAAAAYGAKSGASAYLNYASNLDDVALQAIAVDEANSATRADLYDATSTWICPPGVTSVTVTAWGGGGGGGGVAADTNKASGGGAGGQFAIKVIAVTPGTSYTVTIGAAGTAGASTGGNGGTGGDSWFDAVGTIIAKGGAGGQSYENGFAGGAGSTTSGIGDTVNAGGNGGTGGNFNGSGGGGEGGGTNGTGGNGTNGLSGNPGIGGSARNGGLGGNGVLNAAGQAGTRPGGGGGGGSVGANTTNRAGGAGGAGRVVVSYLTPAASSLTDDFTDNSINTAKWLSSVTAGVVLTESSARINMAFTAAAATASLRSKALFRLIADTIQSEALDAGNQALDLDYIPLQFFAENEVDYIAIIIDFDLILTHLYLDGVDSNLDSRAYVAATHKRFRKRESGGTLNVEYYDGSSWSSLATPNIKTLFALTGGKQGMGSQIWGTPGTTTTQVDNYNIVPAAAGYQPRYAFVNHQNPGVF